MTAASMRFSARATSLSISVADFEKFLATRKNEVRYVKVGN